MPQTSERAKQLSPPGHRRSAPRYCSIIRDFLSARSKPLLAQVQRLVQPWQQATKQAWPGVQGIPGNRDASKYAGQPCCADNSLWGPIYQQQLEAHSKAPGRKSSGAASKAGAIRLANSPQITTRSCDFYCLRKI